MSRALASAPDSMSSLAQVAGRWDAVLALIALLLGLKFVADIIYNVWLHPLARVPGPRPAKLFSSYLTKAQMQLRKAQTLASLHERYGPVVRVAPDEVSISDWTVYKDIYGPKGSTKTEEFYSAAVFLGHENIFSMRNKTQHNGRRKMQSRPYSQQAIMSNESLIASKADAMVSRMVKRAEKSSSGKTVDVYQFCGLFSLEVILKCAFNRLSGEEVDPWAAKLLNAMDQSAPIIVIDVHLPFLKRWGLGRYVPGRIGHMYRQFDTWVDLTMMLLSDFEQQQVAKDTTQRFMATPLLTNKDEFLGRKLTRSEMVDEMMGITFAGSGTTSTTLAYLIYALSRPEAADIQQQLREELLSVDTSLVELRKLPYLDAVIKETFRLYPTILSTLPRVLDCDLNVKRASLVLPKATRVGMQNYVHHRDAELFTEAEKFIPERWLGTNPKLGDMNTALTPFSVGPRDCIGQNLARAELFLAVSSIFRRVKTVVSPLMHKDDMLMEDRFNLAAKGRKLLLDIEVI